MNASNPSGSPGIHPAPLPAQPGHRQLRIFQAFVNVEGLKLQVRKIFGWLPLPTRKRYGFFAVILLAAGEDTKPPLLLSLALDALLAEFSPLSATPPQLWRVQLVDWRLIGAAPPLFQQPGCIDSGWGAAWYDMADSAAKKHRYRMAKLRLWQGRRAKGRVIST